MVKARRTSHKTSGNIIHGTDGDVLANAITDRFREDILGSDGAAAAAAAADDDDDDDDGFMLSLVVNQAVVYSTLQVLIYSMDSYGITSLSSSLD
jgi:hypothetical protein